MIPIGRIAEVGGFHGAVVVVAAVDLGIAVVEAAAGVEVPAVDDPVLTLGLVVDRGALGVVFAQAHAGLDEHAVGLVAHDGHGRHIGERDVVEATLGRAVESAAGCLGEVIVLAGLVVDDADPAIGVRAEGVLRCRIGVSAGIRDGRCDGLDDVDVEGLAVGLAQHLIERPAVDRVQRPRGAVGGHAGVTGGGVNVAWALRPGRRNIGSRAGLLRYRKRGAHHGERQYEHKCTIDSRFHAYPVCLAGFLPAFGIVRGTGMKCKQVEAECPYRGEGNGCSILLRSAWAWS